MSGLKSPVRSALSRAVRSAFMVGGGSVSANPRRWASALNRRNLETAQGSETRTKLAFRCEAILGTNDFGDLVAVFSGTVLSGGDGNVGNDVQVEQLYLEKETGGAAVVTMTLGGSGSFNVPNGAARVLSDPVPPSAFGLSTFPKAGKYWLRGLLSVPAWGYFPTSRFPAPSGGASLIHNSVTCSVTNLNGTGAFTYGAGSGGTGPSDFNFTDQFFPLLIGTPAATGGDYVNGVGDSIVFGRDETAPAGDGWISGFFARSLFDADGVSNPVAGCNFGYSGTTANMWDNATVSKGLLEYGNITVEEFGTNGAQYSSSVGIWAAARAVGNQVIRTELLTRTTGTWGNLAGQTKIADWTTPSGDRIVFNGQVAAQEGILYDKYVSFASVALYGPDRDYWAFPDKTADGTHPTTSLHIDMGSILRAAYTTLP